MVARPGRVVPSVIVGGLLTVGMTVGMGSASAAEPCVGPDGLNYGLTATSLGSVVGGECRGPLGESLSSAEFGALVGSAFTLASNSDQAAADQAAADKAVADKKAAAEKVIADKAAADQAIADKAAADKVIADKKAADDKKIADQAAADRLAANNAASDRAAREAAARNAATQRPGAPGVFPAALPADQALAAGLPMTPAAAMSLGAVPAGLNLMGTTPYDPALLLSAPAGSPLRTMAGADPASLVTSSSQMQAMAFDGLPDGVGVPATLGSLIIAALGAFALRHRLVGRVRREEAESAATTVNTETTGA